MGSTGLLTFGSDGMRFPCVQGSQHGLRDAQGNHHPARAVLQPPWVRAHQRPHPHSCVKEKIRHFAAIRTVKTNEMFCKFVKKSHVL
ncbi:hypothetical protein E2C01_014646 [Portunus trituberculatus]|uniref:Uncharacterized protein n=1 Tax=Portunus trituberculatus TaxID=210409 RepID=A0A5B7DKI1_PORTR|nr:hypothetical protein [Portunus trituberculatus]